MNSHNIAVVILQLVPFVLMGLLVDIHSGSAERTLPDVPVVRPRPAGERRRRLHFVSASLSFIFGAAVVACGFLSALVIWQTAFSDQRITKLEGALGAFASLTCVAMNIALFLDGEWVYPIVLATICIMVGIMMTDRPEAAARSRDATRRLGPLMYVGKAPIEEPGPAESLPP